MKPHAFHITLADLAFLGAIFIGLTFALLLWFTQKTGRAANRYLALALLVMVLWFCYILNAGFRLHFLLAIGPLLFFYVRQITEPEYSFRRKDLLHIIPVLVEQGMLPDRLWQVQLLISVSIYLYLAHRLIGQFYKRKKFVGGDRHRHELRWLHQMLITFGWSWLLWISLMALGFSFDLLYLLPAGVMIWIAAVAHLRSETGPADLPVARSQLPVELIQKGKWLKKVVKEKRYYEDPDLSLSALAEKLQMSPHELSRIVNTTLKKSLADFINEFRLREVLAKMDDPAYDHLTLLGIAYDSGFNSQTTFSRFFKKETGKTPVEYKQALKKDYPFYKLNSQCPFAMTILQEKSNRNFMLKNYLKIAFRGFGRQKLFTLINVIGLSIGISAALVIYLIAHYDLTFDRFHQDGDRIYRVVTDFSFSGSPGHNPGVCGPVITHGNELAGLQTFAPIFRLVQPNVSIPGGSALPLLFKSQANVTLADEGYFKLFRYQWLAGNPRSSLNEPFRVVLTSDQAAKYFPGISYDKMIGRTVIYDTIKTTVTGIVAAITGNTDLTFHDFISFSTAGSNKELKARLRLQNWGGTSPQLQLFVKLAPNTRPAAIRDQLDALLKRNLSPQPGRTHEFNLQPLADIHFNADYGTFDGGRVADRKTLFELLGIGLFLLLLGCINFINLTTAQSVQRAKEIGIRKTLGSSRKQLISQFLTETFLVVLAAVMVSTALVPLLLRVFSGFIPAGVNAALLAQPDLLVFLLFLTIAVSLLSGFYPALVLSGYQPISVLKKQVQPGSGSSRNVILRKSLTVTQFVIAQFFIMATLVVSKQIYYALHKDLGFKKDAIVIINSPTKNRRAELNRVLADKLRALSQIELLSSGNDAPSSDQTQSTEGTYMDGKKEVKMEDIAEKSGDENYIKVYQVHLLAGRNLRPGDTAKVVLVNETLAKRIGFNDPQQAVGRVIDKFNGDTRMQIIGVIADFNQESIHAAVAPLVLFTSADPALNGTFHLALKPQTAGGDEWKTAIAGMRKAWKEVYPGDDFEYHFFDQNIARLYQDEQNTATLLNWATGLSVLISCLGLLGLAVYTSAQRRKEIGVRKVLGASVTQIVVLLSTELLGLILLAFIIVTPFAWLAMNKWMQSFADRTPVSWWIFVLSGAAMLLIALFTSAFQTIRAALTNPVKSLRSE